MFEILLLRVYALEGRIRTANVEEPQKFRQLISALEIAPEFQALEALHQFPAEKAEVAEVYLAAIQFLEERLMEDAEQTWIEGLRSVREELLSVIAQAKAKSDPSEPTLQNGETSIANRLDPVLSARKLLDVSVSSCHDEVKTAYRAKITLWHPDRLEGLAPELQELATTRTRVERGVFVFATNDAAALTWMDNY